MLVGSEFVKQNVIDILRWIDPGKNPVIIQTPENELTNY